MANIILPQPLSDSEESETNLDLDSEFKEWRDSDYDSEEDEDDDDLPSQEEREVRCQTFAKATGTNAALAKLYLKRRDWIVERAISDFFADTGTSRSTDSATSPVSSVTTTTTSASASASTKTGASSVGAANVKDNRGAIGPPVLQPRNDKRFKLLSYNLDGLDSCNVTTRCVGAVSILLQKKPEVIFLQEVVARSLKTIQATCEELYQIVTETDDPFRHKYVHLMLLRKDSVIVESVNRIELPKSFQRTRYLLQIQCKVKDISVTLMTSQFYSKKVCSDERRRQLKMAFDQMTASPQDRTVIFGGHLNLRDYEVSGETAKPDYVYDIWEYLGKRPETKFTWDTTMNDNLRCTYRSSHRFDRLYIRHAKKGTMKPVDLELVGKQRLSACQRFPSDHWGLLVHFDVRR